MTFCPPHAYELVTPPVLKPVSVNDCKAQARVIGDVEDSLFDGYIDEAVLAVETDASMCLMPQTWRLNLDWFPQWTIELRRYPIQSVSSITYVATDGTVTTVSASDYIVDVTSFPPRIVPAEGKVWPTCRDQPKSVKVTFVAGYASAALVHPSAKQAILCRVATLCRSREDPECDGFDRAYTSRVNRLRRFDMV